MKYRATIILKLKLIRRIFIRISKSVKIYQAIWIIISRTQLDIKINKGWLFWKGWKTI